MILMGGGGVRNSLNVMWAFLLSKNEKCFINNYYFLREAIYIFKELIPTQGAEVGWSIYRWGGIKKRGVWIWGGGLEPTYILRRFYLSSQFQCISIEKDCCITVSLTELINKHCNIAILKMYFLLILFWNNHFDTFDTFWYFWYISILFKNDIFFVSFF